MVGTRSRTKLFTKPDKLIEPSIILHVVVVVQDYSQLDSQLEVPIGIKHKDLFGEEENR